jgi:membrane associated rhomboid family serine protease
MSDRIRRAFWQAVLAFFVGTIASCGVFTFLVRNSRDGQAGMGAAFGGFYAGVLIAVITFVVAMVRSSPSGRKRLDS